MDESQVLAIIEEEEAKCLSSTSGKLSEQRRQALQYYYGEPYGNEVEGRSQVVTTEVKDAVEDLMPALLKPFTTVDEIVRFDPQNPGDEDAAQQATDYINYLFTRQNDGFTVLYCLVKDILLMKNGFCKVYWENYEDVTKESYEGLSDVEMAMLMQDGELEPIQHTETQGPPLMPGMPPQTLHDVVFRRTKKYGKICLEPCPPEEILISRDCRNDITKARFVQHVVQKTISELREMGYDVPDDLSDSTSQQADYFLERVERNKFDDSWSWTTDKGNADPTTRRLWYRESYLKIDEDGDGIGELRQICSVGRKVLADNEIDSIPIIGGTAILMPHKFYGLSIHDLVGDLQLVKSIVTRQLLDNAYAANNGRMVVLDGMVNMDDLLTSRPNGIVRTKTLGAVQRLDNELLGAPFYSLLEYFDKVRQSRIGATGFPNAVDPDAVNAKATFVNAFQEAALERQQLMTKVIAETVVKPLIGKMFELVCKHQDKPCIVKLRGKWVQVDPREWKDKFHMTMAVGLGSGSQQTVINGIQLLGQMQAAVMQAGAGGRVVNESNMYNLAHAAAKTVFPREAELFFTNPATLPPKQQPPDPEMLKIQLQAHKADAQQQQKAAQMQTDAQLEQMRQQMDAWKVQFQAAVDAAMQQKDHQAEAAQQVVQMAQEQRQVLMEKLAELRLSEDNNQVEKEKLLLQGQIDSILQSQQALHDHLKMVHEAMLAPKEIVKDPKTGAKRVQPVR